MNRILYKTNNEGELSLLFLGQPGQKNLLFSGDEFYFIFFEQIADIGEYGELKYSIDIKDKSGLSVKEIRHTNGQVFFVELENGDILEIKFTIQGYGEIVQRLFVVERKKLTKKGDTYGTFVLEEYELAKRIDPTLFIGD
ncbi:hypothetical protein [Flavihumibacter petaseus]|uniref:Uncharacterized protein n=1 Tax=Flavihumibacter petaseus NBRC 106054 TaxID=1220578 RepID=A0A0E9N2U6_9BACT|nr:hypothetical protein [Flavihumibacter petaseus]GAO44103.1 hypothetical protein FPE01S_03_01420 [Flavihumibacter petaseus NBRC 106054]